MLPACLRPPGSPFPMATSLRWPPVLDSSGRPYRPGRAGAGPRDRGGLSRAAGPGLLPLHGAETVSPGDELIAAVAVGLLPRLVAGRIAEAAAASTTKGRSDGGLARKKARLYLRGVLTYPQGKPLKPSYAANRLPGPPKCSSARKTRCSPRCQNGSPALRSSSSH